MPLQLWDGLRVPITFIGGYLGAGKTSLLNHLIAESPTMRLVVLVNDVGDINIDASLIASHDGDTIELTNGCVCCNLADGFATTLERVRAMPEPPTHVIVELSGVAEPQRVAPWASTAGFVYDGTIVVVDLDQIRDRASDPRLADTIERQIEAADVVIINKVDLVEPAKRESTAKWLAKRTDAPMIPAEHGRVDPTVILGLDASPGELEDEHPAGVAYTIESRAIDEPVDPAEAHTLLAALGPEVIRAKGLVRSSDGVVLVLQAVGSRRSVTVHHDPDTSTGSLVVISLR